MAQSCTETLDFIFWCACVCLPDFLTGDDVNQAGLPPPHSIHCIACVFKNPGPEPWGLKMKAQARFLLQRPTLQTQLPRLVNHCLFIYAGVVQPSSGELSTSWDCNVISHIYAHARFPHERGSNTRKESYKYSEDPQTWLGGSECALWGRKHPMIDQNYLLQRPEEP